LIQVDAIDIIAGIFRGNHKMIPVGFQEIPQDGFALAIRIIHRAIDKVPARLGKTVKDLAAFLFRHPEIPGLSKGHRSQT
jgi:hypothetical protein